MGKQVIRRGSKVWIPGVVTFVQRDSGLIYVQSTDPAGALCDEPNDAKTADHVLAPKWVRARKRGSRRALR